MIVKHSPVSLEAAARTLTEQTQIHCIAGKLEEILGRGLTALVSGVDNADTVASWRNQQSAPSLEQAARLRAAFMVVQLLTQETSARAVRGWFMGMNPLLD